MKNSLIAKLFRKNVKTKEGARLDKQKISANRNQMKNAQAGKEIVVESVQIVKESRTLPID